MSTHSRAGLVLAAIAALALGACKKQPLVDIKAGFGLADAVWFAEEETLFVFYRVDAEQGLGPASQIELTWLTDDAEQPWAPLASLTPVHTHLPVDCGYKARCGSISLHVPIEPQSVGLRLRYHQDGALTLDAPLAYYGIGPGPAHTNRSLLVYGVMDEINRHVQWRARHQFPNLRNEEVQALGLRRYFRISGPRYGDAGSPPGLPNPYGYGLGATCPAVMTALPWEPVETTERAIFNPYALPLLASAAPDVCAQSTVTDAKGTFETAALARKNPEVRPAFPALHSPIRKNTPVGFFLRPCGREISEEHRAMQEQRLLLSDAPVICIDDYQMPGFADQLAATIRTEVDIVRVAGNDMVVTLALHHDDPSGQVAGVIEDALDQVLIYESGQSSPRVSGAFLFDSYGHLLASPDLKHLALWCPALGGGDDLDLIPAAAERSCPVQPDLPDLRLGPFRVNNLPILTTRSQYLKFIDKYSIAQAGRMKTLTFFAPERTPLSENIPAGEFGVVTFFNGETISAEPDDAFSYCAADPIAGLVVFRSTAIPVPLPLSELPVFHYDAPQPSYQLGLLWDFPFLLRLEYEAVVAGSATAFTASVPFGVSRSDKAYWGTDLWRSGDLPLDTTLLQCSRFCDHPTFDSAGVYNVLAPFRESFASQCYQPRFPSPSDRGFPLDP